MRRIGRAVLVSRKMLRVCCRPAPADQPSEACNGDDVWIGYRADSSKPVPSQIFPGGAGFMQLRLWIDGRQCLPASEPVQRGPTKTLGLELCQPPHRLQLDPAGYELFFLLPLLLVPVTFLAPPYLLLLHAGACLPATLEDTKEVCRGSARSTGHLTP